MGYETRSSCRARQAPGAGGRARARDSECSGRAGCSRPGSVARAQGGTGVIAHSTKGVLLRAEPDYGAAVLTTVAEGTTVGLRTDAADTVYDPDGVTQWWPVRAGDAEGWVAGFYLDIAG